MKLSLYRPLFRCAAFCLCALCWSFFCGCSQPVLRPKKQTGEIDINRLAGKPLPPEQAKQVMREVGENWLYGEGVGDTALAAGTVVAFPPYAAVLLGNAVLSISGYEPIWLSDALPEEEKEQWNEIYDTVGQGPGRFSAAVAGEEFRTKQLISQRYKKVLASPGATPAQ